MEQLQKISPYQVKISTLRSLHRFNEIIEYVLTTIDSYKFFARSIKNHRKILEPTGRATAVFLWISKIIRSIIYISVLSIILKVEPVLWLN